MSEFDNPETIMGLTAHYTTVSGIDRMRSFTNLPAYERWSKEVVTKGYDITCVDIDRKPIEITARERIAHTVAREHFGITWENMEVQSHADVLAMVDRMLAPTDDMSVRAVKLITDIANADPRGSLLYEGETAGEWETEAKAIMAEIASRPLAGFTDVVRDAARRIVADAELRNAFGVGGRDHRVCYISGHWRPDPADLKMVLDFVAAQNVQ